MASRILGFRVIELVSVPWSFVQLYKLSGPVNKYLAAWTRRSGPEAAVRVTAM
jgi:hypothetical protein